MVSVSFGWSENVCISPLILKGIFTRYEILRGQSFFSFNSLLFLTSVVSDEKLAIIWNIILMYNGSFFPGCFQDFLLFWDFNNSTMIWIFKNFFLEFSELLKYVNLCLLPNLGEIWPIFKIFENSFCVPFCLFYLWIPWYMLYLLILFLSTGHRGSVYFFDFFSFLVTWNWIISINLTSSLLSFGLLSLIY